jgi:hypothetical protein
MLSFLPSLTTQIVGVSPFYWQTMKAKISISPLLGELIHHSSYDSSAPAQNPPLCPSNLSIPSRPYFSFLIFFFFTSLINKSIKKSKTSKNTAFTNS